MNEGKTKWIPLLFDLYEKVNVFPEKDLIRSQIKTCQTDKTGYYTEEFNKAREAMQSVLKENFQTLYPHEKISGDSQEEDQ